MPTAAPCVVARATAASFHFLATMLHAGADAAARLSAEVGVNLAPGIRLKKIKHAVTKYRITLQVHQAELLDTREIPGKPWKYLTLAELSEMPMSVTGREIVKILSGDSQLRLPM